MSNTLESYYILHNSHFDMKYFYFIKTSNEFDLSDCCE